MAKSTHPTSRTLPWTLAGLALSGIAAVMSPLGGWAAVPGVLAVGALGIAVARELRARREQAAEAERPVALNRQVERGRRLAIFEPETGLLAEWYFSARISEECERARRYGGQFTLVGLEVDRDVTTQSQEDSLLGWMRGKKRVTDLVCYVSAGRYLMLLPGTDAEGAGMAVERIEMACPVISAVAEYPMDGKGADELRDGVLARLGSSGARRAA